MQNDDPRRRSGPRNTSRNSPRGTQRNTPLRGTPLRNTPRGSQRNTPTGDNPRITPLPRPVGVDPDPAPPPPAEEAVKYVEASPQDTPYTLYLEKRVLLNRSLWVIAYVAVVLLVDMLASSGAKVPINWAAFDWRPLTFYNMAENASVALNLPPGAYNWMAHPLLQGISFFKLIFWLFIPLVFSWRMMDWGYWRMTRWIPTDLWALTAIAAIGVGAMLTIKFLPGLQEYYTSQAGLSFAQKADFVVTHLFWVASWVVGYEFLQRYVLLQRLDLHWPTLGWLLVPVFDGAYHLVKPWPEMAAMVAFGLVLTWWARTRRNLLLPLAAHLIIEIELIAFRVLV